LSTLVEQQGERRIGRVDDDRLAAQIRIRVDLRLHEDPIEAVIAAGHDGNIRAGKLRHCDRIVDRGMGDLMLSLGKAVAKHVGIRRVEHLDRESMLGEQIVMLGRVD
jgi:hypothetical protein